MDLEDQEARRKQEHQKSVASFVQKAEAPFRSTYITCMKSCQ